MKYIIECEHSYCREHNNKISDIMEKMYAIEDNTEFLVEEWQRQFPSEFIPNGVKYGKATQILVDFSRASDEFYIGDGKDDLYIEVETSTTATSNDMDFLPLTERKEYKLGETYSYYTKLADTNYYFRFM